MTCKCGSNDTETHIDHERDGYEGEITCNGCGRTVVGRAEDVDVLIDRMQAEMEGKA